MARKEELPLRIGCLRDPARQQVSERLGRLGRRQGAAALADDAHNRAAVADVVMKLLQGGIASRLPSEVALSPQQRLTRAQVGRNGITRPAELAGDGREEDAELVLRHGTGVPGWIDLKRPPIWALLRVVIQRKIH